MQASAGRRTTVPATRTASGLMDGLSLWISVQRVSLLRVFFARLRKVSPLLLGRNVTTGPGVGARGGSLGSFGGSALAGVTGGGVTALSSALIGGRGEPPGVTSEAGGGPESLTGGGAALGVPEPGI